MISLIIIATGCGNSEKKRFQGYVEGENIYLASPYSGTLIKLGVKRGELVDKGSLIFQLDPNPQDIVLKQLQDELGEANHVLADLKSPKRVPEIAAIEAQIGQIDADMVLDKIRVDRMQKLYAKGATDKDSVDAAEANLAKAQKVRDEYSANLDLARLGGRVDQIKAQEKQVGSALAKYKQAKWELQQKQMNAPASGLIFDTYFKEGEFVAADQAVASLLIPANIHIEFFVPVEILAKIKVGQKVSLICDGCDKAYDATISYISPEAQYLPPLVYTRENNDKLVFRIKANPDDSSQYKPGQPVMVYLK